MCKVFQVISRMTSGLPRRLRDAEFALWSAFPIARTMSRYLRRLRERGVTGVGWGIKPLRGFFPSSAGHHQRCKSAFCCAESPFLYPAVAYESELSTLRQNTKKSRNIVARFCIFGDSVGIRTQDPQLRRLLLYPAELPNRSVFLSGVN